MGLAESGLSAQTPLAVKRCEPAVPSVEQLVATPGPDWGRMNLIDAIRIVRGLVRDNPGDPNYPKTYWLVLRATKFYSNSIPAGEAWVRIDTTAADSGYFDRQIADAVAVCRFGIAARFATAANEKYPGSGAYYLTRADAERQDGRDADAIKTLTSYSTLNATVRDPHDAKAIGLLSAMAAERLRTADSLQSLVAYRDAVALLNLAHRVRADSSIRTLTAQAAKDTLALRSRLLQELSKPAKRLLP